MTILSPSGMLDLWERGARRHPLDRALLLLDGVCPDQSLPELADVSIGQRDQALIAWRSAVFGRVMPGYVDCPACQTRLEFALDGDALRSGTDDVQFEVDGLQVRRPTSRDVAEALNEADPNRAIYRLAQRCCVGSKGGLPTLSAAQLVKIESALAQADAAADIALNFCCEQCGNNWQTAFDISDYLWREIEVQAATLLSDVHTLARAYGWSEGEILAMSDARRSAYIDRVLA